MASLVADRLRQRLKTAKSQKRKEKQATCEPDRHSLNNVGPAGRMEKEIGFEQFGRVLSGQAPKAISDPLLRGRKEPGKESGFDLYRRHLSIDSKNEQGTFEMYRRSLGIESTSNTSVATSAVSSKKGRSLKDSLSMDIGRSQSDIGSIAESGSTLLHSPGNTNPAPTMFRRSLSDDVADSNSAMKKQRSQQQILMTSAKPNTVHDALATMTSMLNSDTTEEKCFSARDEDEFSHASTEAGSYADEGPFDSLKIVMN